MALVIDANSADALSRGECPSSRRILAWVRQGGRVCSGGLLQKELGRTSLSGLLQSWSAAGRLILISDELIDPEVANITPLARSDDPHVLAVVKIGDVPVIVTGDGNLIRDLKDPSITGQKRKIISQSGGAFSKEKIVMALLRKAC